MENIKDYISKLDYGKLITAIIIVIVSILIYKSISFFLLKGEEKSVIKNKKTKTYARLIRTIIRYAFIIITTLIVLQLYGVNVSSLLAGVGIAGVVIGLAIQDWLKDIIRGSSILSDNYFQVGDVVKYKDIEAKVMVLGLKTTKIQDLKTNNIIAIANRNIEEIQVVSNLIYLKAPMPYEIKVVEAEKVVDDIIKLIKDVDDVQDVKYIGITELGESSIDYLIEVTCDPKKKRQVNRNCLRCILLGMEERGISVPYKQIDIHNK